MKTEKKYKVIAKVSSTGFVKYNVNDLLKFAVFLDRKFPSWRWFNVYRYTKDGSGEQLGNYSCKNRPSSRFIYI
jgi:hypothetical protein